MAMQTFVNTLIVAQTAGAALGNSVSATSLLPAHAKYTMPAQDLYIGKKFRLEAAGQISNIVTTPGTFTFDVRLGAVVAANGGAMALNIVAKSAVSWMLVWELTCRAIGSGTSANLMHQGRWTSESVIGSPLPSAGGAGTHLLPASSPAVGTGFDSTAAVIWDLYGTWSIANAGNTITLHQYSLIALN
jgi:hypothetical protein